ncbi:threonine ammonia-lyase [Arcticibacterium luteifluviistationis]|uniref:Serine dehydratase n=1 Tax=Arcticibacterium luteifluviistationis TaxID=1784714 RepID=A0A2Z4GHZ0_9BACT|nr:threonine/serine dehydratase [Arcticibacterium luteifluviistationis]AWW00688.1 serine dehydratase [Arcticibacterium luteifluviistationis]
MTTYSFPSKQELLDSHERIKPFINKTSLLTNEKINKQLGLEVYFKCENEQKIGAFKARGGINAILLLSQEEINKGLVTHSSGNHAQAVAYAGNIRKTKTWVVMPETAPSIKIKKVKELGAEVIFCKNTPHDRQTAADKIVSEHGAIFIHPFDNHNVIMGQATVAKEILEEIPEIDSIIPPVGGGGLLSGTGLSAAYFSKKCTVYAAEPEGAADAILSFKSGKVEHAPYVKTIADGLQTHLSERTLEIIRTYVKAVFLVSEEEILQALNLIYKHLKIIVEPSAAVSFAALIKHKDTFKGKKVAVVLTGGNLDEKLIPKYLNK